MALFLSDVSARFDPYGVTVHASLVGASVSGMTDVFGVLRCIVPLPWFWSWASFPQIFHVGRPLVPVFSRVFRSPSKSFITFYN